MRVLSQPVERAGVVYVLQVGQDITAERNPISTLVAVLAVGGFVAMLAALAAGERHTLAARSCRSATRSAASASSRPTPATSCGRRLPSCGPAPSTFGGTRTRR